MFRRRSSVRFFSLAKASDDALMAESDMRRRRKKECPFSGIDQLCLGGGKGASTEEERLKRNEKVLEGIQLGI